MLNTNISKKACFLLFRKFNYFDIQYNEYKYFQWHYYCVEIIVAWCDFVNLTINTKYIYVWFYVFNI